MSVADILRVSSNVGTVQIAYQKLSGKGEAAHGEFFAPYIDRFGFTRKTGIDLPGEVKGQVPPYSKWSGTTIGNIPFGQGIALLADAAGRVLRDARRRRRLAPAAHRDARQRQAGAPSRRSASCRSASPRS